jgi:hypothetical protein
MEHRETGKYSNKWDKRQGEKSQENRSLVNESPKLIRYNIFREILLAIILVPFIFKGFIGFVSDISKPSEQQQQEEIKPKEEPVEKIVDKNKAIKDRIYKEKGIILSDEDIKKYGITK